MSGFAVVVARGNVTTPTIEEALSASGDLVWVHLTTNNDDAKQWLGESARLPGFVVEALTAVETRPRCDAVGDGAVINLRGRSTEEMAMSDPLVSIRIYAHEGHVFSVTRRPLSAMARVRGQAEAGMLLDPGDLIAELAQAITEELDPIIADLGDTLDNCEEKLDVRRAFELRRGVNRVRGEAIGYRRFLNPQRAALEKLAQLPGEWMREDDRLHLNAAADRAARMAEELESIRERAALTHETLTDLRAEQLDQRSLAIAMVAMVFLPLTFLTGLLGMNVHGIPYAEAPWAFWGVVAFCGAIAVPIMLFFRRHQWLRR